MLTKNKVYGFVLLSGIMATASAFDEQVFRGFIVYWLSIAILYYLDSLEIKKVKKK